MSAFGDFTDDDAFDTERAAPEQVARKLQRLRREAGLDDVDWDDIAITERSLMVAVAAALVDWLRREGAT